MVKWRIYAKGTDAAHFQISCFNLHNAFPVVLLMKTQIPATNVSFLNTQDDMVEEPAGSLASSTMQSARR